MYLKMSACSYSSGSVSSFNDDDYEVDENSDDEEQEESGDYCKGMLARICSTIGLLAALTHLQAQQSKEALII